MAMIASHLAIGKRFDRLHVLDAGVVDEHVDLAEQLARVLDHAGDLGGLGHVGGGIGGLDPEALLELHAGLLDLGLVAEAVEHHVHAGLGEGLGDAEADAAGRAGDDGGLAGELARQTWPGLGLIDPLRHDGLRVVCAVEERAGV